ncbi:MAG: ATP-dependent 6-phosphofructokinase [Nitrospina sp.]|mgnify:FL=1|jgi:ATP-dependent phosphofructokinase / diphosphate-dependent phosphofructokinase|nr:ATP-dependent 6-phosphofructokinase [Nitrospina sp.]MBT3415289.1 ATP-dependent 6-phosphofructokinase [Nitrospina sp.]MBT3855368.1 ATP-dependent 6-phosphofructokinase [Nitrospina sp.]MBT4106086.1 ATP-dependent 6-phosphofructokinase [Nitrospina sp.]MBT4389518.1 ATP-dependent 6-phosphofructokinase [Nitrospina sp.]
MSLKRVGILTGGGDCSGLNAVIRAVTRSAIISYGAEVIGIEEGFEGLIFDRHRELTVTGTRDILPLGGTILGTTNKGDPFEYRQFNKDGHLTTQDYSQQSIENFRRLGLDCLFVVGGDGTLQLGYKFFERGVPVIGIPKTIDNDLMGTDYTFGYQTAVQVACDALDRLQTTGESHQRVMVLEVMGRDTGWIALEAGISGGAHVILIPEIPYDLEQVLEKIRLRQEGGSPFSVIVVAEGAKETGKEAITSEAASTRLQGVAQLGGVGNYIAKQLSDHIDLEVRCTVLGHTQRGGTPLSFDRVLGTRLGIHAVEAAAEGKFGNMVALQARDIVLVPLESLAGLVRQVPPDSQLIHTAESIGISLGRRRAADGKGQ